MIKSMTGYGRAEALLAAGKLTVEVRSLNAKNAEISIKTSLLPKDKEMDVRRMLADRLRRGTIDLFLSWEPAAGASVRALNLDAARTYYSQLLELRRSLPGCTDPEEGAPDVLLAALLRLPDVADAKKAEVIGEAEWPLVEKAIDEAVAMLERFRQTEGAALYKDVTGRVKNILDLYDEIDKYDPERIETVKARIRKNLEALGAKPDKERFEQELVYYLEKMDINEERVRLRQHCRYFLETIDTEPEPGKKLGFIIQEMGREINTTGSKANHALIQKAVVRMKDELEKIREQSLNIL